MLPILEELSKIDLKKTQLVFDAIRVYPSAMWEKISVFPKVKTGFAFKPHMNNVFVIEFNNQSFNQKGIDSAFLEMKNYNPTNLIFQPLPVNEKVISIEFNRIKIGYINAKLTLVFIQEVVKMSGKVIGIDKGLIYRKNFEISRF